MRAKTAPIKSAFVALAVSGALLSACGTSTSASPTTTASSTKSVTTSTIPAGTVLRVGEQLKNLSTAARRCSRRSKAA